MENEPLKQTLAEATAKSTMQSEATAQEEDPDTPKLEPFDKVIKNTLKSSGLFTLYQKKQTNKLFAEIAPTQLNRNYLATITLESALGEGGLYRGMPLGDFLFTLRRVNNTVQFVIPNIYFRTGLGDLTQREANRSFSDSTLYVLPIKSIHPKQKTLLVDLSSLLLSDSPGLTPLLAELGQVSYKVQADQSRFGKVKAFPQNVELEAVYGFLFQGGDSPPSLVSLPDNRAFNLSVRYSLSQLPENNGYRPRLADDRVGYFVTAYRNLSSDDPRTQFVRYVNRWHLEKQDPTAPLSPPKQPIVFWIEKTVPLEYRDAVREGVLMWNSAFEKIGIKNAIEVKQQPNNATWDPADVRYNTIRWFGSVDAGFAMGPSRVNPITGEILDADIIVDANFTRYIKQEFRTLAEQSPGMLLPYWMRLTQNPDLCTPESVATYLRQMSASGQKFLQPARNTGAASRVEFDRCYGMAASQQFAVGSMALSMLQNVLPSSPGMKTYINQFVSHLIAHEVGHTLGLRHNFHGSSMLKPEELNNLEVTGQRGLSSSVMDYVPVNLAPDGVAQGDFFSRVVGPYDDWAIAYGYQPGDVKTTQEELPFLQKIASRAPEPELSYATDEDAFSGLDPLVNVYDLSSDLLVYGRWQAENARRLWSQLNRRYPLKGDSYDEVLVRFNAILGHYFNYTSFLTSYVGGQGFNRFRAGDAPGRNPFEPVSLENQRQALQLIQQNLFDDRNFQFSSDLLNQLAPSRWMHWGAQPRFSRLDYPLHERILMLQSFVLADLLSSDRLARLQNTELKMPPGEALTLPELFNTLQQGIWTEVVSSEGQPLKISSLRRGLQRQYLDTLITMALRTSNQAIAHAQSLPDLILALQTANVPDDARTLAWYELRQLRDSLKTTLRKQRDLDTYTKAHLEEAYDRLTKVLDARFQTQ